MCSLALTRPVSSERKFPGSCREKRKILPRPTDEKLKYTKYEITIHSLLQNSLGKGRKSFVRNVVLRLLGKQEH